MPVSRLCVTVVAESTAELRRRRDEAVAAGADLVELRLDSVTDPDVGRALADRPSPVIVTCRPRWEGGSFRGTEEERRRLLREAAELGAEYVDVEWLAGFDEVVTFGGGRGIVVSMHDFDGVPSDLEARLRAMRATGAEIVKIATMARRLRDVLPLLELSRTDRAPLVLVAMGMPGLVTRIAAARFRSPWSYAGNGIAPGQLSAERLLGEFRFKSVDESTSLYGVVGRPIGHSLSPPMHNSAFEAIGRNAVYVPFEAADAEDFLEVAAALDVRGASVTAPFKRDLLDQAARADDLAHRVGAANTLRREREGWFATNTDVPGFLAPLEGRHDLRGARVAVLGAGGAARAVVVALAGLTRRVTVYARDVHRAEAVASLTDASARPLPPMRGSWDVLVNATPVGTAPGIDETLVPADRLEGRLVYDLVYNPSPTRLLREAAAAGCETIGGLDMLVAQAQRQFTLWTGTELPDRVFRAPLVERLQHEAAVRS